MNRHELRTLLVETRLRWMAGPLHTTAVAAELGFFRALDARRRPRSTTGLTAIVKTFERPHLLRRLVQSLRRHYPELPIVVADDSREPTRLPGVETVVLPFDSGVSAGRAAALDRVETPYTWNLDDDFVIYSGTDVSVATTALDRQPEIDLIGGVLIDLPHLLKRRANPAGTFHSETQPCVPLGTVLGEDYEVRDKVSNFFIARTEKVRLVGWTPVLKRLDHADFFTRARGRIVSTHCERLVALHAQTPFDRRYQAYRSGYEDQAELFRRYPGPQG